LTAAGQFCRIKSASNSAPWVNEKDIVAGPMRRRQLRQVVSDELTDLVHLKWHHDRQIQDRRGARERYQGRIRLSSTIEATRHGTAGQYGNGAPRGVEVSISPAMALVEPHEEISSKSQNGRLRQQAHVPIVRVT